MFTQSTGQNKPICVNGRIKGTSLVGEHKVYPLVNSSNYTPYQFGYWQLIKNNQGKYTVLNVLYT